MRHRISRNITMRLISLSSLLGVGLLLAPFAHAQAPSVTATCKDGTAFSGTTRSGACRGHKGVESWTTPAAATSTVTPPTAGTSSPGIAPAAPPRPRSVEANPTAPPPGIPSRTATNTTVTSPTAKIGGPGQVWVNTDSKVYHCPGDRYYGKTKSGEFMSQSAAQAAGDRPSQGKACNS